MPILYPEPLGQRTADWVRTKHEDTTGLPSSVWRTVLLIAFSVIKLAFLKARLWAFKTE